MNTHMLQRQQKRDVHTREGRLCRLAVAEVTTTLNTKTKEKPKPPNTRKIYISLLGPPHHCYMKHNQTTVQQLQNNKHTKKQCLNKKNRPETLRLNGKGTKKGKQKSRSKAGYPTPDTL